MHLDNFLTFLTLLLQHLYDLSSEQSSALRSIYNHETLEYAQLPKLQKK